MNRLLPLSSLALIASGFSNFANGADLTALWKFEETTGQTTNDSTALVWIRPTAADISDSFARYIDNSSNTGAITSGYRLMGDAQGDNFRFFADSGPANTDNTHSRALLADTWIMLAVRYDTDGDSTTNVLFEGDTVDTAFVTANNETVPANGPILYAADEDTDFGAQDTPTVAANHFDGQMDEAAFFTGLLTDEEIATAFNDGVSFVPPAGGEIAVTQIDYDSTLNTVTLTWDSEAGKNYDGQFSTDLINWSSFNNPTASSPSVTTQSFNVAPNQKKLFLRVIEL